MTKRLGAGNLLVTQESPANDEAEVDAKALALLTMGWICVGQNSICRVNAKGKTFCQVWLCVTLTKHSQPVSTIEAMSTLN